MIPPEGRPAVAIRTAPTPHPDPWVNLPHRYVAATAAALGAGRLRVDGAWIDPSDPRDATIVYAADTRLGDSGGLHALVWDEETGWRAGRLVGGHQGMRTRLADVRHLGGGVLPSPGEVERRLRAGADVPRVRYRSYRAVRDGLDDAMRSLSAAAALA